ncbi:MAG: hypothetical protein FJW23_10825 [Acidimicrobiia bacterium]|nr:hypothetical protein [Acidimicrobiia bacterium]
MISRRRVVRWTGMAFVVGTLAAGCAPPPAEVPPPAETAVGADGWLSGTTDEKFETVAKQLRGFDMAMVETGYRFNELYWAVQDGNFGFAKYQTEKIRTALENGLERRPRRAKSAADGVRTTPARIVLARE